MSLSVIATLIAILNGGFTFIKSVFGKTPAAPNPDAEITQDVKTLNRTAAVEAVAARTAQQSIDEENQNATNAAADRHDQLAAATGLRARAAVLEATRNDSAGSGANPGAGTNG